ncbi:DoxX family protein [Puniceicoccus vermicola]|uniref:DoxX family protein n=1 Tax=Puniceicoccus vermicola TaxID=388746 RepID=A0A7X1AXS8_9BACT|nr:DoxX family protein [Puniceicoccus vermicola]MBC2601917.1 DoxX family protein [Puniceicoccus vermicola]
MPSLKQFAFGGAGPASTGSELGLLGLRVFTGLALALAHGVGKFPISGGFIDGVEDLGFPAPVVFAWAAALSELVGGLFLAAGFLTRISAFLILATMLVAAFGVHGGDGFADQEKAFLYAAATLPFVLAGCGRVGVDQLFRQN